MDLAGNFCTYQYSYCKGVFTLGNPVPWFYCPLAFFLSFIFYLRWIIIVVVKYKINIGTTHFLYWFHLFGFFVGTTHFLYWFICCGTNAYNTFVWILCFTMTVVHFLVCILAFSLDDLYTFMYHFCFMGTMEPV